MEQKLCVHLCLVVLLCAGPGGHGLRVLHDVDAEYGRDFAFGSKATAGAEAGLRDPSFDDYESEISRVEFEPELGTSYAAAPNAAAAAGPAPGPVTAGSAARATGSGSMKWWLPPSTMPSFPLFPNPGGIPGMPMPGVGGMPAMPFKPIGWGAAPASPGQAQPTPPAAAAAAAEANDNPNPNEVIIN